MQQLKGCLLKANAVLQDTYFEDAVIFITEHNEGGAAGFVINRLFHRKLNELEEFSQAAAIDLFEGGPVDALHLYCIHSIEELGGEAINGQVYFGGDFKAAVEKISAGKISASQLKIFIGYCGWNAFELEAEIEEGSWEVLPAGSMSPFEI